MSKDTFYFSHDTNAFLDPKIRVLISEYGIISYAMFWIIVEMLSTQKDLKIPIDGFIKSLKPLLQGKHIEYSEDGTPRGDGYYDDENNKIDDILVGCHRIELAYATSLFNTMIDVELFKTDGKYFWSDSLNERMNLRNEKSQKQRDNANKRWHPEATVDNNNANAMPEDNNGTTTNNATQCLKGKERKGKEIKVYKENNKEKLPFEEIINHFNNICKSFPQVKKLTNRRKYLIQTCYKEYPDVKHFQVVFEKAEESDFLAQRTDKKFSCGLDWILQVSNFTKIYEGNYTSQVRNNGHKLERVSNTMADLEREEKEREAKR